MGELAASLFNALVDLLSGGIVDTIGVLWDVLSETLLTTPDVTSLPQVQVLSGRASTVVGACVVLVLTVLGVVVMGRGTVQDEYDVAGLVPRAVIGFVASSFSTPICRALIGGSNALTASLTGMAAENSDDSLAQVRETVVSALTGQTNLVLALVIAVIVAVLVMTLALGWIARLCLMVILTGVAPLALACHATPWTQPLAVLWWRALLGALATVTAQAVTLGTAFDVLLSSEANLPALGIPDDPNGTLNLLIVICLLWATVKIPGLISRYVGASRSPRVGRLLATHQLTRVLASALRRGPTGGAATAVGQALRISGQPPRLPRPTRTGSTRGTHPMFSDATRHEPLPAPAGENGPPAFSHPVKPHVPRALPTGSVPPVRFSQSPRGADSPLPTPTGPPPPVVFGDPPPPVVSPRATSPVPAAVFSASQRVPAVAKPTAPRRPVAPTSPVFSSPSAPAGWGATRTSTGARRGKRS